MAAICTLLLALLREASAQPGMYLGTSLMSSLTPQRALEAGVGAWGSWTTVVRGRRSEGLHAASCFSRRR
jgi:hypothetical protein